MNANEIKFGVEFETIMPGGSVVTGAYHVGRAVEWLPEGWKAERDGSLSTTLPNHSGCEFVSPILKGREGLESVERAIAAINEKGGRVNHTCGVHVSVDFEGATAHDLAKLMALYGNVEKALYVSTGSSRRETRYYSQRIKNLGQLTPFSEAFEKAKRQKYVGLNLTHIARGRNRIEFRVFAGTLNIEKILGHIMMCLGLVQMARTMTKKTKWNYKNKENTKSRWERKNQGPGECEFFRLLYRLGWRKGQYRDGRTYGIVEGYESRIKPIIKTLKLMAKKYDQNN